MYKSSIVAITVLLVALFVAPLMPAYGAVERHDSSYSLTAATYQPVDYWGHHRYYGDRYYRPYYRDRDFYGYYRPYPRYYDPYYRPGFSVYGPSFSFGIY